MLHVLLAAESCAYGFIYASLLIVNLSLGNRGSRIKIKNGLPAKTYQELVCQFFPD